MSTPTPFIEKLMKTNQAFSVKNVPPEAKDFVALRKQVGWGDFDINLADASLKKSLFHVTLYCNDKLIGMGRVVGDGIMYFYVQDIAITPKYQGCGLGQQIMQQIESYLTATAHSGATIALLAVKGKEGFYQQFGYINRPNEALGHGMCKFVK